MCRSFSSFFAPNRSTLSSVSELSSSPVLFDNDVSWIDVKLSLSTRCLKHRFFATLLLFSRSFFLFIPSSFFSSRRSGVKDAAKHKISRNKNKHNNRTCDQKRSSLALSLPDCSQSFDVWVSVFIFSLFPSLFCYCRCRRFSSSSSPLPPPSVATAFFLFGNRVEDDAFFSFGLPQIVLECGRLRSYRARSRCDTFNVTTCFHRGFPHQSTSNKILSVDNDHF